MTGVSNKKTCFVIGPIGNKGSDARKQADLLILLIVDHVLKDKEFNYHIIRADYINEPGLITDQIIEQCMSADLIVADLTNQNPNAFYELALAHAFRRPVITLIKNGQTIPFDNAHMRTIVYDLEDAELIEATRHSLIEHTRTVLKNGYKVSNPVTHAIGWKQIKDSGDKKDELLYSMSQQLDEVKNELNNIKAHSLKSNNVISSLISQPISVAAHTPTAWSAASAAEAQKAKERAENDFNELYRKRMHAHKMQYANEAENLFEIGLKSLKKDK